MIVAGSIKKNFALKPIFTSEFKVQLNSNENRYTNIKMCVMNDFVRVQENDVFCLHVWSRNIDKYCGQRKLSFMCHFSQANCILYMRLVEEKNFLL